MPRKFKFGDLVGNANTIMLLKRSLELDTFKKFTIFGGILGTGKSTCAGIAGMTLTCENPSNGEPCMQCQACLANSKALDEQGISPYLKVINMGKKNKFEDITELIKDVFVLQGGERRQVYIFEEAHAIKNVKGGFTSFLAEIDRMPKNVFVIMCTTSLSDIPNDLKSRAIIFNFNRLDKKDSLVLAQRLAANSSLVVTNRFLKMIIKNAKGVPRDIEKLIEFVKENNVTEDELRDYLQEISSGWFIQWFSAMKLASLSDVIAMQEDILQKVDITQFKQALKEFCINAAFLVEGDVKGDFIGSEIKEIKELFSSTQITKMVSVIENLGRSEADLNLALLKFSMIMQDRSLQSVVLNKSSTAAKERVSVKTPEPVKSSGTLQPLTLSNLSQFGNYEN